MSRWQEPGAGERRLLAICRGHRMKRVLKRMLDETEFLSPYGIRALSRVHAEQPYVLDAGGARYTVDYQPGESNSGLFGGNSNWRGPIWMPVNYLLIESLQQFHHYYGDDFKVECPTGSGQYLTLNAIADELSQRLIGIFARDAAGRRAVFGEQDYFQSDAHWRDYVPFHEYFHGDTGAGVGASHQTGWTGVIAKLIQQQGEHAGRGCDFSHNTKELLWLFDDLLLSLSTYASGCGRCNLPQKLLFPPVVGGFAAHYGRRRRFERVCAYKPPHSRNPRYCAAGQS